jgi:hypothetical protein
MKGITLWGQALVNQRVVVSMCAVQGGSGRVVQGKCVVGGEMMGGNKTPGIGYRLLCLGPIISNGVGVA